MFSPLVLNGIKAGVCCPVPDLHNIITPTLLEPESWHFERIVIPQHMSCVTYHPNFHRIGPVGRFGHRVAMSVWMFVCLSVCAIGCIFFVLNITGFVLNEMSLKIEYHSKFNVIQNEMSLKMKYHLKLNVSQNGISLKLDCQLNLSVT